MCKCLSNATWVMKAAELLIFQNANLLSDISCGFDVAFHVWLIYSLDQMS